MVSNTTQHPPPLPAVHCLHAHTLTWGGGVTGEDDERIAIFLPLYPIQYRITQFVESTYVSAWVESKGGNGHLLP
jgi:hypothetical protein